jgi:hypothetical protein
VKKITMTFKEYDTNPTFLDIELQRSFGHSRTQQFLTEVNETICWDPLEKLATEHYPESFAQSKQ